MAIIFQSFFEFKNFLISLSALFVAVIIIFIKVKNILATITFWHHSKEQKLAVLVKYPATMHFVAVHFSLVLPLLN
jgi:hypothetical protein